MDLLEAIKGRRSIRRFQAKPVPKEVLQKLIDAAIMAPSVAHKQPWLFTMATGKARDKLAGALAHSVGIIEDILARFQITGESMESIKQEALRFYSNLGDAPVVVVVSMPIEDSIMVRKMYLESAAMAIQNLMLAAHAEGLGTCPIAAYSWIEPDIKQVIGVENREIVLALALGYPAETPKALPRKREVVQWLGFES